MEPPTQEVTTLPIEAQTQQSVTAEPIKSVETFWERLDEVLNLVKSGGVRSNRLEEILEVFGDSELIKKDSIRSFIFQPDRISLSSNDDATAPNEISFSAESEQGHQPAETFSTFRIRLQKGLVNVKSVQLLSAVIPNATTNIPDTQLIFFYYRLRTVANATSIWNALNTYSKGDIVIYNGTYYVATVSIGPNPITPDLNTNFRSITYPIDKTRPNYYDLNPSNIQGVYFLPTFGLPPEESGNYNLYNRTFQGYSDLIGSLNVCCTNTETATIPNDITFTFNDLLNKVQFIGNDTNYYYMPCGYLDPNIPVALTMPQFLSTLPYPASQVYVNQYSLNLRLGFTWNGIFTNPFTLDPYATLTIPQQLYYYLRKKDPDAAIFPIVWNPNVLTANSYGDLVNTSCVKIYCDFIYGSTQDSLGNGGLLSIVPVNTTNLGVGFYQNNFNNPLEKIPKVITEIGIRMVNDQGQPYYLPNSATVLLELALEYY